jgi:hypothetical protein
MREVLNFAPRGATVDEIPDTSGTAFNFYNWKSEDIGNAS